MIRTTIDLPDDVYQAARSVAIVKRVSLGEAVGELVRRGLRVQATFHTTKPFPCFELPENAEAITLEQTLEAEDEL